MIKALAPGMRRGCSWVWLSIALAGGFAPSVFAQAAREKEPAPTRKSAATKAEAEATPPAEGDNAPAAADAPEEKTSTVETFRDPNAEAALKVIKSVPGIKATTFSDADVKRVLAQAGGENTDRDLVQKFVNAMAYALIDKTNINALINPPPNFNPRGDSARAIQRATDHLLDVYHTARRAKNAGFLSTYNDLLVDTLPKLLDNNLISRLQAMIVLGQTGSARAVPVFLKELKDPKQTVWVKHWAARGLSNLVENGVKIDAVNLQPIEVARTIAGLLENDKELPWPVQMRLLEALGSMRVASNANSLKAEMATAVMPFLADPEAHPEIRAEAAWALGMMRVNPATRDYNYPMIAFYTGQVAVDLGEQIDEAIAQNRTLSEYLTGLLIGPIHQTFNGLEGARDSGLLKVPGGGNPAMTYTRQIADLTSAVSRAAVDLVKAPTGQIPKFQKTLTEHVAQLKAFLEKNPPKSFRIVPNGAEFPPVGPQVAEARLRMRESPVSPGVDPGGPGVPSLSIPDIRDYQRINAELTQHLDAGRPLVRLAGAEGQRLLVAGLAGGWEAVVEVEGFAGPELAAGMNAPGLSVVCRGSAADGAGSGLRGGRLMVLGDAGPAVGYAQKGGTVIVAGEAGPRAGLNQSGGVLVLLGAVGPLAGERQSGGHLFVFADRLGAHAGRGRTGGRFVSIRNATRLDPDGSVVLQAILEEYTRVVGGR